MDSRDYAHKLEKEFAVDHTDALKMLDMETDEQQEGPYHGGKIRYQQALDAAYESIRDWLLHGDQYAVNLDWDSMVQFVASHRRACVWAVLLSKAKAQPK
jgi:hypothetical protein